MRVFVAGGTGAVGKSMIPQLLEAGHHVVAISRHESKAEALRRLGAGAVVCDVFDAPRLAEAVRQAAPDAIVNQLTDLPASMDPRAIEAAYVRNNRVRREGTRNLLAAAASASVPRFIVQSMATWYRPVGSRIKHESDPLWTDAPEPLGAAVRTVADMEAAVLSGSSVGVVLRYGAFYGPGTWYSADGDVMTMVRRRKLPIVGAGDGVTSFVHVHDAAAAAVAALSAPAGVYNIVDDEPAAASEWMPALASALGAPAPRRVPAFLARLIVGKALTTWMTTMRGASSEKAKREMGWQPRYASWRAGLAGMLSPTA
jgi:nucleoside-diphosphate-sugar epimerase